MDDRGRKPNRRKNDTLINYIMMGLVALLTIFLIFYIIKSVASIGGSKSLNQETQQETQKETQKETRKETQREKDKETKKETEKETQKETEKETQKETQKETEKETETESNNVELPTPDKSRRQNDPNAAVYTAAQIKNLPESVLVDMIIAGDLGYGKERLDIINEAGLDYDELHRAVNRKLQGQ